MKVTAEISIDGGKTSTTVRLIPECRGEEHILDLLILRTDKDEYSDSMGFQGMTSVDVKFSGHHTHNRVKTVTITLQDRK